VTVSRDTAAGRAYLDLRKQAKEQGRPTEELLNLYALEGFLDRLSRTDHVENLVLKGGVLLAAFNTRRATRDVDLQADALSNDADTVRLLIGSIASVQIDDGLAFDADGAIAEVIREGDEYSGIRISMRCQLATADVSFHVDVNVGDAIWPEPEMIDLPRLLGGVVWLLGYSIEMVIAEKLVSAIQRGTANTRWRDFCDVFLLTHQHEINEATLRRSISVVSESRGATLMSLSETLPGYEQIAQTKWSAWVRKQGLEDRLPIRFSDVLAWVARFSDRILISGDEGRTWDVREGKWTAPS
jgi:hypothetical protein